MSELAQTPKPPYYAVIFTAIHTADDTRSKGYAEMADKMLALATQQSGFLGTESAKEKVGITVSYWTDVDSIKRWKQNTEHLQAQKRGREDWYEAFKIRIAKVERDYS